MKSKKNKKICVIREVAIKSKKNKKICVIIDGKEATGMLKWLIIISVQFASLLFIALIHIIFALLIAIPVIGTLILVGLIVNNFL